MNRERFGLVVFCMLFVMPGCRAPSQDWNGTWKLNPSLSRFQDPAFTISISSVGVYSYEGEGTSYSLRCDGKDWPMGDNRTQVCVKSGPTVLELTRKENGVKTALHRWELSAGGNILTSTVTAFRPSGPVNTGQLVAWRISGSNSFAGQWRDKSYIQLHDEMTLRLDSRHLHIGYPSGGEYVNVPLDGTDAAVHGPHVLGGVTYAVRPAGPREILIVTKHNGTVLAQGYLELSDDGNDITDSWWSPDKPAAKSALVYERSTAGGAPPTGA